MKLRVYGFELPRHDIGNIRSYSTPVVLLRRDKEAQEQRVCHNHLLMKVKEKRKTATITFQKKKRG